MATTYRVTLTAHDGTCTVQDVDQDGWDTIVDECEATHPTCVRERQMRDGFWKVDAGWEPRKIVAAQPAPRHSYVAANAAIAALNDAQDRREVRRERYLRTGR